MIKRLGYAVAAFAFALTSLLALAPATGAEGEEEKSEDNTPAIWLQISPVSNKVVLKEGEDVDYNFTVSNIGSEEFSYHVYASPYSVNDEDYNINFNNETDRTQISRWIKFYDESGELTDKASFKIGKGEKQTVRYKISVPDSIPAGGQYATIFAESDETEGEVSGSGIKTVSRVGLIIYGHTEGETEDSASITDFNIPAFMTSGNISGTARVENNGNTDFETIYEFKVQSIFGKDLYEKNGSYNILPDTARRMETKWENTPIMGFYRVHYRVSALNDEVVQEKDKIVVILPIFVIVLSIILLTLIITWIIILVRKRRERKSRRLV